MKALANGYTVKDMIQLYEAEKNEVVIFCHFGDDLWEISDTWFTEPAWYELMVTGEPYFTETYLPSGNKYFCCEVDWQDYMRVLLTENYDWLDERNQDVFNYSLKVA